MPYQATWGNGSLRYLFENYAFDTDRREFRRGAELVTIPPQVFDLLDYLIRNRERVVSKDDLIDAVWKGRIVSETALTTRLNAARSAIGDTGEEQRLIKTLPRKGYRFVGTVREADRPATAVAAENSEEPPKPALALPDKPSIAVLPFHNMSDSAEDIITELSCYPDLFVAARNSSFTYRGTAVRIADVARELGVRYVVEGSVRRGGSRVRVTAKLIDALNGKHLWAQRYDRELQGVFAIQDDVTSSIVAVLPARIEAAAVEEVSRKGSNSLEAYDYLLRGKYYYHRHSREANQQAQLNFDHAIEADPRFATAYAWRACTLGQAVLQGFRAATADLQQEIRRFVETAARLDQNDTECNRIMCRMALIEGQFAKSEHHLERALAMNPNDPRLVAQRGINLTFLGDSRAAIPWLERAMRLDPFSADRYYLDLVRALFMAERATEAIAVLERTEPIHYEHYVWLAACNVAIGEDAAAHQAGKRAVALRSELSITAYLTGWFTWKRP